MEQLREWMIDYTRRNGPSIVDTIAIIHSDNVNPTRQIADLQSLNWALQLEETNNTVYSNLVFNSFQQILKAIYDQENPSQACVIEELPDMFAHLMQAHATYEGSRPAAPVVAAAMAFPPGEIDEAIREGLAAGRLLQSLLRPGAAAPQASTETSNAYREGLEHLMNKFV